MTIQATKSPARPSTSVAGLSTDPYGFGSNPTRRMSPEATLEEKSI